MVPAVRVLFVPGVVEAMVALAVAEFKPVFTSLAQTVQPFLAFVLTVTVRGVGLVVTLLVLSEPSASVLAFKENENVVGTVALTATWSPLTLAVLKPELSITAGTLVCVATVPVLLPDADDLTVTAALFVQLKQYNVPAVRSPLGKVTAWPVTLLAVPMPGQAVPPEGQPRLVVPTTKVAAVPSVYPVGKVTTTDASVAVLVGLAHTVPVVAVLICMRSKRTIVPPKSAAWAVPGVSVEIIAEVTKTAIADMIRDVRRKKEMCFIKSNYYVCL